MHSHAYLALCTVQQLLIVLEALPSCATDDGSNAAPLHWHELGQVQQPLLLLTRPLGFLDRGVQPLIPACLALGLEGEPQGM